MFPASEGVQSDHLYLAYNTDADCSESSTSRRPGDFNNAVKSVASSVRDGVPVPLEQAKPLV
jgi:hypothetical protein